MVFHHQMKHLEVRQKYSAVSRIFNSVLGVSSRDKTLHLMLDILHVGLSLMEFYKVLKTAGFLHFPVNCLVVYIQCIL